MISKDFSKPEGLKYPNKGLNEDFFLEKFPTIFSNFIKFGANFSNPRLLSGKKLKLTFTETVGHDDWLSNHIE